jgi:hypothetical protein
MERDAAISFARDPAGAEFTFVLINAPKLSLVRILGPRAVLLSVRLMGGHMQCFLGSVVA